MPANSSVHITDVHVSRWTPGEGLGFVWPLSPLCHYSDPRDKKQLLPPECDAVTVKHFRRFGLHRKPSSLPGLLKLQEKRPACPDPLTRSARMIQCWGTLKCVLIHVAVCKGKCFGVILSFTLIYVSSKACLKCYPFSVEIVYAQT